MENQLIVYTPKKNVKKMILKIFLGIFVSISIFMIAALGSASLFIRTKWNKTDYVDLKNTSVTDKHINSNSKITFDI